MENLEFRTGKWNGQPTVPFSIPCSRAVTSSSVRTDAARARHITGNASMQRRSHWIWAGVVASLLALSTCGRSVLMAQAQA